MIKTGIKSLMLLFLTTALANDRATGPDNQQDYDGLLKESYLQQIREQFKINHDIDPLDTGLAGDQIDLYNGLLSFRTTDIAIPGNNDLPVHLTRTLNRSKAYRLDMADWDVDVPFISGTVNRIDHINCQEYVPPIYKDKIFDRPVSYFTYYKGLTLNDGQGYSAALIPVNEQSRFPYAIDKQWQYYTKDNWLVRCSGKDFIVRSPSGLEYTMNSRRFDPQSVWWQEVNLPWSRNESWQTQVSDLRVRATRVSDPYGNTVDYRYNNKGRLTRIKSSDGRQIDLHYSSDGHRVVKAEAHGRTWQYHYYTNDNPNHVLQRVELPDGTFWRYYLYFNGRCLGPCEINEGTPISTSLLSYRDLNAGGIANSPSPSRTFHFHVFHPEGAKISFELKGTFFHRYDWQRKRDACPTGNAFHGCTQSKFICSLQACIGAHRELALKSKRIYYHKDQAPYTWHYDYSLGNQHLPDIYTVDDTPKRPEDTIQTVTVTHETQIHGEALTRFEVHDFYRVKNRREGRLLRKQEGWIADNTRRYTKTTRYEYHYVNYGATRLHTTVPVNFDTMTHQVREERVTTHVDGDTYTRTITAYDTFGAPLVTVNSNDYLPDAVRWQQTRYHHDYKHWILEQPAMELVGKTESGMRIVSQKDYYQSGPAQGKLFREYEHRLLKKEYQWDERGQLKSIHYNGSDNEYVRFDDYHRSVPRTVTIPPLPQNEDDPDPLVAKRRVDNFGNVTFIEDFRGHCSHYAYHPDDRLAAITPCNSYWLPTTIQYEREGISIDGKDMAASPLRQTVQQGKRMQVQEYDGLLRNVRSTEWDADNNASLRSRYFHYNADNQPVFSSYFADHQGENKGATIHYDSLMRPVATLHPNGKGNETREYRQGNTVQVTDGRGYVTTRQFQAFGEPEQSLPVNIQSPHNKTTLWYNAFDQIQQIQQNDQIERRLYSSHQQLIGKRRAETQVTCYGYNPQGRLAYIARGLTLAMERCQNAGNVPEDEKIRLSHNHHGQLHTLAYPDDTPAKTFTYDENGQLIRLDHGPSTWHYRYNDLNMLTAETFVYQSKSFPFVVQYDAMGYPQRYTYPSGESYHYRHNALGQPTALSGIVKTASYHPNGQLHVLSLANGMKQTTSLNDNQLPRSFTVAGNGYTATSRRYGYDDSLNVSYIDDTLDGFTSVNMRYDGLNQLTGADGSWGHAAWDYDQVGNIRSQTIGQRRLDYRYDDHNRLSQLIVNGKTRHFRYDQRGNTLSNGLHTFTYNSGNRLSSTGKQHFFYDGHNRRFLKEDKKTAKGTLFLYSITGQLMQRVSHTGHGADHLYFAGRLVAKVQHRHLAYPPRPQSFLSIADDDLLLVPLMGKRQTTGGQKPQEAKP